MKGIFIGLAVAIGLIGVINYVAHLEKNPLTGRTRFISLSQDQLATVVEWEEKDVSLALFIYTPYRVIFTE